MPKVIALKDGRVETLFEVRHFEELIDKYMGHSRLPAHSKDLAEMRTGVA